MHSQLISIHTRRHAYNTERIVTDAFGCAATNEPQFLESVKAIRALRIFESSARFRVLMSSVWDAIRGGLVQLAAIIFIIIFMFAVIGMELFGHVDYTTALQIIASHSYVPTNSPQYQRFDSLTKAFLATFMIA